MSCITVDTSISWVAESEEVEEKWRMQKLMKMIIDISEEQYKLIRHGNKSYTTELELMNAVANGTPLPKVKADMLDKIRSEIKEERRGYPPSADEYKTINKVLQIIDKHKAESEEA